MKINRKKLMCLTGCFFILATLFFIKSSTVFSSYEDPIDEEIKTLNDQIQSQKKQLEDIAKRQEEYAKLIKQKGQEQNTLQSQLEILDGRLSQSELEIESATLEVSKNNLEVKKIEIDIVNKEKQIEKEKEHISTLLKLIYKQNQTSPLEAILLNESLTDFINQLTYLENTNKEISDSLNSLKDSKQKLDEQGSVLQEKQKRLEELKSELENKKQILQGEVVHKEFVLTETKKSEAEYKKLLAKAKKENDQAMAEISSLEKTVREKLAKKSDNGLEESLKGFVWPTAKNTITATFHDPDYPFRKSIGEHSGVDIRAAQGSTLKAAAAGYVARVKFDGSTAYAYIMIIHAEGFSTVYGHISGVSVSQDEYVSAGQIIGRTGGTPRTAGSGAFSTGPHLHFEVRKDGIPVNPLDYLP